MEEFESKNQGGIMQIKDNTIFLEDIVKEYCYRRGKEYKGILSMAEFLVNYYYAQYKGREAEYILFLKMQLLYIDLLDYLSTNYSKLKHSIYEYIKNKMKKIDEEINPTKVKLLELYRENKFPLLMKKTKNKYLLSLLQRYNKYNKNREKDLIEEIGLKEASNEKA